jgi:hypothetical protein
MHPIASACTDAQEAQNGQPALWPSSSTFIAVNVASVNPPSV